MARGASRIIVLMVIIEVASSQFVCRAGAEGDANNPDADYLVRLNQLVRHCPDPNLNAAPLYGKARALYAELSAEGAKGPSVMWTNVWTSNEGAALQTWVEANSDALRHLRLGTERPCYSFLYEGAHLWAIEVMDDTHDTCKLLGVLLVRAQLRAAKDNLRGAIADLLAGYRFASDFKSRPLLVEQMAGRMALTAVWVAGLEILHRVEVDPDELKVLQEGLAGLARDGDFLADLRGDELMTLSGIDRLFRGKAVISVSNAEREEIMSKAWDFWDRYIPTERMDEFTHNYSREELERLTKESYECFRGLVSKTPFQWYQEDVDWQQIKQDFVGENLLLFIRVPAVPRIAEYGFRRRALRDAFFTTVALLRYRNDRGGFPKDLQTLISAAYLPQSPMDPYSDKPLIYRRKGDSFLLYSVGRDMEDNGGRPYDWGVGGQPGDYVFWPPHGKQDTAG